jgi:hypothetical protein
MGTTVSKKHTATIFRIEVNQTGEILYREGWVRTGATSKLIGTNTLQGAIFSWGKKRNIREKDDRKKKSMKIFSQKWVKKELVEGKDS